MSQIHWINPVNGAFDTAADWSGGVVPGPADDAILDAAGSAFTVTATGTITVDSIQLAANASLDVSGGRFTATDGDASGTNAGNLIVSGGYGTTIGSYSKASTFVNTGLVEAKNNGVLSIVNSTVTGQGGTIISTGYFEIDYSTVTGQTFSTGSGGFFWGNDTITLGGKMLNHGGISLEDTNLIFDSNTSLTGGGGFLLTALEGSNTTLIGTSLAVVLTNVNNTVTANNPGIDLGGGKLTLVNDVGGTIETANGGTLVIDTGRKTIVNDGLMVNDGPPPRRVPAAETTIASAIDNNGVLATDGGRFTLAKAVTGSGHATIGGGVLIFRSSFSQDVTFTGATGVLELGESQDYTGSISGFSHSGGTSLDLRDIGFVSASEASFSGTSTSGVLTVSDGAHTARISLVGDYLGSTFTCSSDDHGGVEIVHSASASRDREPSTSVPPHAMASAMAALGPSHSALTAPHDPVRNFAPPMLLGARAQLA